MQQTSVALSEDNLCPRLHKSLQKMMDFLCKAATLVQSSDTVRVAAFIWGQIKDMAQTEYIDLGDGVKYTLRFIRQALALSLGGPIEVLVRDEKARIAEISINTEVLMALPSYEELMGAGQPAEVAA